MGKIILLNTPIGNLGDLTPRVLGALKTGKLFSVEDTRVFRDLLNHLGISAENKRILAFHEHSDSKQLDRLFQMAQDEDLYVTSDAGSPIISDPAYPLVARAYELGIKVESFSGVSSPVMALELSGLPPIPFHFHGFVPREKGKRTQLMESLGPGTHIFFEAPTRIEETMDQLSQEHPDIMVAIVRELSKKFEQVVRFKAGDWEKSKAALTFKGEFIFLVHKTEGNFLPRRELESLAQEILAKGATPKVLAKLLGLVLDRPTKDIYSQLGRHKDEG